MNSSLKNQIVRFFVTALGALTLFAAGASPLLAQSRGTAAGTTFAAGSFAAPGEAEDPVFGSSLLAAAAGSFSTGALGTSLTPASRGQMTPMAKPTTAMAATRPRRG